MNSMKPEIYHYCRYSVPSCICNKCANDTDEATCCLVHAGSECCPITSCEEFRPEIRDREAIRMSDECYSKIHDAVAEMLKARKAYPDLYPDDRIIVMTISIVSVVQPDAPVCAVYQAVRTELISQIAADGCHGEK